MRRDIHHVATGNKAGRFAGQPPSVSVSLSLPSPSPPTSIARKEERERSSQKSGVTPSTHLDEGEFIKNISTSASQADVALVGFRAIRKLTT